MNNVKLPFSIYLVYFTKDELKNINPCRFNEYRDAYNYARKYDKNLVNTVIMQYNQPISNGDKNHLHNYLMINKILRKIYLYSKKYDGYVVNGYDVKSSNTYCYISLDASFYLYTNVFFNIKAKIEFNYYKNKNTKEHPPTDILLNYNSYIDNTGKIFTYYKNKRISKLYDPRSIHDEWPTIPYIKECSINLESFYINDHNKATNNKEIYTTCCDGYSINNIAPSVFNGIMTLISKLSLNYKKGFASSDPSFTDIIKTASEHIQPYPIKYNNVNDFLDGFLSDKNIY